MSDEVKTPIVSFPFACYPAFPFSGYMDAETYKSEVVRLHKHIDVLTETIRQNKQKCLVHLTLGSAMEEYFNCTKPNEIPKCAEYQWSQLMPYHILELIEFDIPVHHMIISPDVSFSKKSFKEPQFLKKHNEYTWKLSGDRCYSFNKCNVNIFCTPVPHNDLERNNKRIKSYTKDNTNNYIKEFLQTANDVQFIDSFYKSLELLFDTVNEFGGAVTCFSFAVFHKKTLKSNYCDYVMFSRIKNLFSKEYSDINRLLAEWTYSEECYTVKPYNCKGVHEILYWCPYSRQVQYYVTFGYGKLEVLSTSL
jgi:hypothetical protein